MLPKSTITPADSCVARRERPVAQVYYNSGWLCCQMWAAFERHMAAHKPFCCNLCSQSFKNARLLWVHKEFGHSTQCHLCSQTFENVSALWKHRESHVSHCDSDCTSCKQYERDWKLYAKLSNVAGSQFPSTTCGDVFSSCLT